MGDTTREVETIEKKVAIFAFSGEPMSFVHAMLNAFDMNEKGYDVKLVVEGNATRLVKDFSNPSKPFATLYEKTKELGLIDCVCRTCAEKMGALTSAEVQELPLCDDMRGHPSMSQYIDEGYEIISL